MKTFQLFLLTIFVVVVTSMPGGGDKDGKFKEKHKKHMECFKQTKQLKDCCEIPEPKEDDEVAECKELIAGIEEKEGKEKMKAFTCFLECAFKNKGFLVEKEIKWDKLKEYNEAHKDEAPGFEEVGSKALEFCEPKINEKIEWFKNHKPKHNKPKDHEGEKRCCMLPAMVTGCLGSYVVRNCPADKWKNTDECNAVKANATSIEECMS